MFTVPVDWSRDLVNWLILYWSTRWTCSLPPKVFMSKNMNGKEAFNFTGAQWQRYLGFYFGREISLDFGIRVYIESGEKLITPALKEFAESKFLYSSFYLFSLPLLISIFFSGRNSVENTEAGMEQKRLELWEPIMNISFLPLWLLLLREIDAPLPNDQKRCIFWDSYADITDSAFTINPQLLVQRYNENRPGEPSITGPEFERMLRYESFLFFNFYSL